MADDPSKIRFAVADDSHDAGIRQLLRDTPMPGDIAISMQREPNYFAAARAEGGEHHAIVAINPAGRIVCTGGVSIRERYYNGTLRRVGYLGQLRLAASHAGRFDVIRRGYRLFREILPTLNLHTCFTSIAADNTRAQQFLERGLAGLPRYEFVGDLVTLMLSTSPSLLVGCSLSARARSILRNEGLQLAQGIGNRLSELVDLVNRQASTFQFAPAWRRDELSQLLSGGQISENSFRVLSDETGPIACAALWDQRQVKQVVVNAYSSRMQIARPFYNLFAELAGRMPLPAAGQPIQLGFVAPLAVPADQPEWLVQLLRLVSASARSAGITAMTVGFDARDPRLAHLVRNFRSRLYRTRLYTVTWQDQPPVTEPLDGRLLYPEVALL